MARTVPTSCGNGSFGLAGLVIFGDGVGFVSLRIPEIFCPIAPALGASRIGRFRFAV